MKLRIPQPMLFVPLILAGIAVAGFTMRRTSSLGQGAEAGRDPALAAFAAVSPIDAHAHIYKNDPAFKALFERLWSFYIWPLIPRAIQPIR
jgi:hypothetical protein